VFNKYFLKGWMGRDANNLNEDIQNYKLVYWAWLYMPVILPLRKLRQEDCEFQASLGYIMRPCVKKKITSVQSSPKKKSHLGCGNEDFSFNYLVANYESCFLTHNLEI
jgi:hypothetical protein